MDRVPRFARGRKKPCGEPPDEMRLHALGLAPYHQGGCKFEKHEGRHSWDPRLWGSQDLAAARRRVNHALEELVEFDSDYPRERLAAERVVAWLTASRKELDEALAVRAEIMGVEDHLTAR